MRGSWKCQTSDLMLLLKCKKNLKLEIKLPSPRKLRGCVLTRWHRPSLQVESLAAGAGLLQVMYPLLFLFPCLFSSVQLLSHVWHIVIPWTAVVHYLPEFTQIHVHWVGDVIQPSRPLLSPSPPASNLSQHQGLFQWVNSSHQVAKVLELQLQHQSFQWIFRVDFL